MWRPLPFRPSTREVLFIALKLGLAILLLASIIITLTGCSTLFKRDLVKVPSITPTVVYQMGNAYGVVQALAITYVNLPTCSPDQAASLTVWCRDPVVVIKLAGYDTVFVANYEPLALWARDPKTLDGLDLMETYAAATGALAGMQMLAAQYQMGQIP